MAKRPVVVHVGGQRYIVRSDAEEVYIRALAGHVDERIQEVQRSSKPVSPQSLVVLAALNIADELFKERQKRIELRQKIKDKSMALIVYVDKEVKAKQAT